MYKALSFGLVAVTVFLTPLFAHRILQQEDVDTRAEVRRLLKEATELATQIESSYDRSVVFVRIGGANWSAGDKATATESFDKALKIVDTLPQENPNQDFRESYRASIAGVRARAGDIAGAQQMLSLIKSDSEKSFVLSDIALAQAYAGHFDDAVHTASAIQDSDWRDQSFEWTAIQQANAGDAQGAARLAQNIKNAQYRAETLARIAALRAEGGHTEEARFGIQEALGTAELAEPSEGGAGGSFLAACASEEHEQPRDAALQSIAMTQAETGDTAGALETIKRMHNKAGRENVLATVAEYQARAGDLAGAQASIGAISRDACKTAALHGIVVAQFEAGNLSAALLSVNEMTDPEQKARTLAYLGEQVVKQGAFNSAMGILARARAVASQITDIQDRAFILVRIAHVQVQAGSRGEATKTLAQAVPDAIAAHEQAKKNHAWSSALGELIEQQAEIGDLDGAWSTLARLDDGDRTFVVQNAAHSLSKAGDTQGALAWTARQVSPRDKALALVGVAEGILDRLESEKK